MAAAANEDASERVLVSHTGHALVRRTAFRFAAGLNHAQTSVFFSSAGALRFAFNHHIARVKQNLDIRRTEAVTGIGKEQMTRSLSCSKVSFINEFNALKSGALGDATAQTRRTLSCPHRTLVRSPPWNGGVFLHDVNCQQRLSTVSPSGGEPQRPVQHEEPQSQQFS